MMKRRDFLKWAMATVALLPGCRLKESGPEDATPVDLEGAVFRVLNIPDQPFLVPPPNNHTGIDSLIRLMGIQGLKFYRSAQTTQESGPQGLIAANDVVLIKVNAQWKYRGCTNSDVIRGLVQKILDFPGGFGGEVIILENGQGRGSLNCDTSAAYGNNDVHANANDETHTFLYLVDEIFKDPRVSAFLLDPIRSIFISAGDHQTNGYRKFENISYPCFTSAKGSRIELREGIWNGSGYNSNLKLINVPVLKHHDTGGSEITASLKHFYGLVSMADGNSTYRHYSGLGETCGNMVAFIRTPVLNIIDAIWISHSSLTGYPAKTTQRSNQLAASQDPVALDYWTAKYILYPVDNNPRHHPEFSGIDRWLSSAADTINQSGRIPRPEDGILIKQVTKNESQMQIFQANAWPIIP